MTDVLTVGCGGRRHFGYQTPDGFVGVCGAGAWDSTMKLVDGVVDCKRCLRLTPEKVLAQAVGKAHLAAVIRWLTPPEADLSEIADLIDACANDNGPLDVEPRARLFAVLDDPNQETWSAAHTLIVACPGNGRATLWQAAIAAGHPSVPASGPVTDTDGNVIEPWPSIPTREALLAGLRLVLTEVS